MPTRPVAPQILVELHCVVCGKSTGVGLEMAASRRLPDVRPRPEDVVVAAKHVPACPRAALEGKPPEEKP